MMPGTQSLIPIASDIIAVTSPHPVKVAILLLYQWYAAATEVSAPGTSLLRALEL